MTARGQRKMIRKEKQRGHAPRDFGGYRNSLYSRRLNNSLSQSFERTGEGDAAQIHAPITGWSAVLCGGEHWRDDSSADHMVRGACTWR